MADEPSSGRNLIEMLPKVFFEVHVILYAPKQVFQHSQFISSGEPSEMYISLLFLYMSETWKAYISLHFDIF